MQRLDIICQSYLQESKQIKSERLSEPAILSKILAEFRLASFVAWALAIAMHDELKDDGIYVGIVNIKGNIGSDEYYAPAKIAEKFYQLYTEKKDTEITY